VHEPRPQAGLLECRLHPALGGDSLRVVRARGDDRPRTGRARERAEGLRACTPPDDEAGAPGAQVALERCDGGAEVRRAAGVCAQAVRQRPIDDENRDDAPLTRGGGESGVVAQSKVARERVDRAPIGRCRR
jgi:hypothetical protein